MNVVMWSKKAKKQLTKIPLKFRIMITDATRNLVDFPECKNVKSLKNHKYSFRMRIGRYRVFFDHKSHIQIVAIQEVKKRDERSY